MKATLILLGASAVVVSCAATKRAVDTQAVAEIRCPAPDTIPPPECRNF